MTAKAAQAQALERDEAEDLFPGPSGVGMYALGESFPGFPETASAFPGADSGRYAPGSAPDPLAVPVVPSEQGLGEALRTRQGGCAGGSGISGTAETSYHYGSGGIRPGNHYPPADMELCSNGYDLCIPARARAAPIDAPAGGALEGTRADAGMFDAFHASDRFTTCPRSARAITS